MPSARNKQTRLLTGALGDPGILAVATLLGIAIRIGMILLSPRYGYFQDHDDLARWALQSAEDGVLTIYDHSPRPADLRVWTDQGYALARREMDRLCNYPPLCVYLLAGSGAAFKAASPDRVINTIYSRAAIGGWSLLFDLILAAGCAKLVAQVRPGRPAQWTYVFGILAPPFWLVSSLWGQVDTWVLAPAVWMLWAMVANRWTLAGLFFGLTAAMKPQAAAFLPVWALAFVTIRPYARVIRGAAVAAITLFVVALPFTIHSGAAWWKQSYQSNLFEHSRGLTTLMAFNAWYLNCLVSGSVDESVRWLGITRATWGQAGLGLALVAGFAWMLRTWRNDARGLVVWTTLVMLAFVMIPTRVHDRFIILILPFLVVCAAWWWGGRIGAALFLLTIVATGQVTWPQWLSAASADWEPFVKEQREKYDAELAAMPAAQRAAQPAFEEAIRSARQEYDIRVSRAKPIEWTLTLLALIGTILGGAALVRLRPT